MAVHHVDVNSIGASRFGFSHLLAQAREIRGENRWCELDGSLWAC
jgi:hypothetical protein